MMNRIPVQIFLNIDDDHIHSYTVVASNAANVEATGVTIEQAMRRLSADLADREKDNKGE
jgi:hypothetical protein